MRPVPPRAGRHQAAEVPEERAGLQHDPCHHTRPPSGPRDGPEGQEGRGGPRPRASGRDHRPCRKVRGAPLREPFDEALRPAPRLGSRQGCHTGGAGTGHGAQTGQDRGHAGLRPRAERKPHCPRDLQDDRRWSRGRPRFRPGAGIPLQQLVGGAPCRVGSRAWAARRAPRGARPAAGAGGAAGREGAQEREAGLLLGGRAARGPAELVRLVTLCGHPPRLGIEDPRAHTLRFRDLRKIVRP